MGRILISEEKSVPYFVEEEWDAFNHSTIKLPEYWCIELIAYYRGEEVTRGVVTSARDFIVFKGTPLPLPIRTREGVLKFVCTDEEVTSSLSVASLARHFELISDILELDPNLSVVELPYSSRAISVVLNTISTNYNSTEGVEAECIELAKFLRPIRFSFFARLPWKSSNDLSFLTDYVAKGMSIDEKLLSAHWAKVIPDEGIWPLMQYLLDTWQYDAIERLLGKRPTALFVTIMTENIFAQFSERRTALFLDLLKREKYEDQYEVQVDSDRLNRIRIALVVTLEELSSEQAVPLLTILGVRYAALGNLETPARILPRTIRIQLTKEQHGDVMSDYVRILQRERKSDVVLALRSAQTVVTHA